MEISYSKRQKARDSNMEELNNVTLKVWKEALVFMNFLILGLYFGEENSCCSVPTGLLKTLMSCFGRTWVSGSVKPFM